VPSYLVETFLARARAEERTTYEARARAAAEAASVSGTRVRFEGAINVPEDEICFFVFDAPTRNEALLVARRAALDPIRVVEAFTSPQEEE